MKQTRIPIENIHINDSFWNGRIRNAVENVVPYQWRVLNDKEPGAAPSHAVMNYKIAAGLEQGEFEGMQFQDSDLAKWIEAASYSLLYQKNPEVEAALEEVIEIIGKAQQPDGYLSTYYILKYPDRKWKEIAQGHELYVTGHLLEAAVAYYQVTGKDSLLKILEKNVDLIRSVFGCEEGKLDSYPGHEEIELALMKAYAVTGDKKYFELADYFVERRGVVPGFLVEDSFKNFGERNRHHQADYYQAHAPIREQKDAEGHAVRAMYYFTGAADVALEKGDETLVKALEELWEKTVGRRMYLTGGVGSQATGERFTIDYDLPNDTCYTETCAAIGLAMWCLRMLRLAPRVRYADIMERALYNNVMSGISQDGERYFYVNPLFLKPDVAHYRADHASVEPSRVKWFGCACCPPNVIRTLCGLGGYVYTQSGNDVYQHLYIGNESTLSSDAGEFRLTCESKMPWEGEARITFHGAEGVKLHLRVPSYAKDFTLKVNGKQAEYSVTDGYALLSEALHDGDVIDVSFAMPPHFVLANPRVTEDCGKAAVMRGPLVYCAEQVDNFAYLASFRADLTKPVTMEQSDLFDGIVMLKVSGTRQEAAEWGENELYRDYTPGKIGEVAAELRMIPYFLWNNRGEGEMMVWMNAGKE